MSTGIIILICLILFTIIIVQIGRVSEFASQIRGEDDVDEQNTNRNAVGLMVFGVIFLVASVVSAYYYKNWMLGYGPHESASAHGSDLDFLFNITLFFTGIVFVLTHIALFWFSYKYRYRRDGKALFMPHDNKLEVVWTVIPAFVMVILVVRGLVSWNEVMADVKPGEDYIEIEATGMQFAWLLRYPGADGKLGPRDFRKISAVNPLGQDWSDTKNLDDIHPTEIVLPVNKKVRVRITSRDVLHDFDLPHFRVKMDAVPGIPTSFVFTPTVTTEEYRENLSKYPEYQIPSDEEEPDGPQLWETFDYELACAELCGKGHFSMKKIVKIVSEEEYEQWLATQESYYLGNIRNTADDPWAGELLSVEVAQREADFVSNFNAAVAATEAADKVLRLDHVNFETGSANLTALSRYELDYVAKTLQDNPEVNIEVAGHTDNTGDAAANKTLSANRALVVKEYLMNKGIAESRLDANGYGQDRPVADNNTEDGRAENRRTELIITNNNI